VFREINSMNRKQPSLLVCLTVLIVVLGVMSPPRARAAGGLYTLWAGSTSFLSSLTFGTSGGTYSTVAANVGYDSYYVVPDPADPTMLYVLSYGSSAIYSVNILTGAVGNISVGTLTPWEGAVSPDGKTLYFSTYSSGAIYALDLSTQKVTTIALSPSSDSDQEPQQIVIGPHGQHLYVAVIYGGSDGYGAVEQIDLATNTVTNVYNYYNYYHEVNVASAVVAANNEDVFYPTSLALSPDGSTLYVDSSSYDGDIYTYYDALEVINVQSGELENVIPDPNTGSNTDLYYYTDVAVDPASGWVYATYDAGSSVLAYDPATQQDTLIATSAMTDPLALAFGPQNNVLYVGNIGAASGTNTASLSMIDTNPADAAFNTVVGTVPATTATTQSTNALWSIVYVPPLLSAPSVMTEAPAGPVSGNLTTSVAPLNLTGCAVTYSLVTPPDTGGVSLGSTTGEWTLTPSLADLGASLSFTYKVSTVASCPAAQAATATGTVSVAWEPSLGTVPAVTVPAGAVSGPVDFSVYTPVPVTFTVSSSNPSVVGANGVFFPTSCSGFCDLYVRGGSPGVATISLTATTSAGASSTTTFQVTVSGGSSSGSGGGTGGMGLLSLLLLAVLAALAGDRRNARSATSRR
jgi:DNA-binding beta-propeller fold protein YncE